MIPTISPSPYEMVIAVPGGIAASTWRHIPESEISSRLAIRLRLRPESSSQTTLTNSAQSSRSSLRRSFIQFSSDDGLNGVSRLYHPEVRIRFSTSRPDHIRSTTWKRSFPTIPGLLLWTHRQKLLFHPRRPRRGSVLLSELHFSSRPSSLGSSSWVRCC